MVPAASSKSLLKSRALSGRLETSALENVLPPFPAPKSAARSGSREFLYLRGLDLHRLPDAISCSDEVSGFSFEIATGAVGDPLIRPPGEPRVRRSQPRSQQNQTCRSTPCLMRSPLCDPANAIG